MILFVFLIFVHVEMLKIVTKDVTEAWKEKIIRWFQIIFFINTNYMKTKGKEVLMRCLLFDNPKDKYYVLISKNSLSVEKLKVPT